MLAIAVLPNLPRSLIVLLLAAFALRATAAWWARDAQPWNDQITYLQRAEDLLDGKGYTGSYQSWVRHPGERQLRTLPRYAGAYQAPGYPAFIALVMGVAGRDLVWVKVAQVLLGVASTWLVYRLGCNWFDARVGLAAGWLFALDPTLIAFTHYVFAETLFTFLLLAGIVVLTPRVSSTSLPRMLLVGVLLALAAYVKSSVLYFLPVLAMWFVWWRREHWRHALLGVGVATLAWGACVAPWTLRNWRIHDGFVLIDSSGPFNFWRGNQVGAYQRRVRDADENVRFPAPFDAFPMSPVAEVGGRTVVDSARNEFEKDFPTDLEVMHTANRMALEYIALEPKWFVHRAWYKIVDTWNPTSFVMRHIAKRGYGEIDPALAAALSWACVLAYLLVMALALPVLCLRIREPRVALVALLVGYYTAIHAVTFGLTRFRLPLMPFLMVLAGCAIASLVSRVSARRASAS